MMSRPTALITSPMQIEKMVFAMSSPPSPMKVANAMIMSAKISGEPKRSATSASGGANTLSTWREPKRLCELAIPLVVRRAGSLEPDLASLAKLVDADRLGQIRDHQVEMPMIEVSSTEIRRRVATAPGPSSSRSSRRGRRMQSSPSRSVTVSPARRG